MSEEQKTTSGPSKILGWLQLIMAVVLLAALPGQWYVYKERQDNLIQTFQDVAKQQKERDTADDIRVRALENVTNSFAAFMDSQKELNRKIQDHITDKNQHVTEGQVINLIMAQLQPLTVSIGKMEVIQTGQQKQLDRVESMGAQTLNLLQQDRLGTKAP